MYDAEKIYKMNYSEGEQYDPVDIGYYSISKDGLVNFIGRIKKEFDKRKVTTCHVLVGLVEGVSKI